MVFLFDTIKSNTSLAFSKPFNILGGSGGGKRSSGFNPIKPTFSYKPVKIIPIA